MRKFLVLVLPALLTGCGVVAAFIPPIGVGDALGVEGQSITTTFGRAGGAALSTQAVSTAEETVTQSFTDMELDLRGFSLKALDVGIGLYPSVVLTTSDPLAEYPASFTLTRVSASASVSDEVHGEAHLSMSRSVSLTFTLDESSCDSACTYTYAGEDDISDVLSINIPSSDQEILATFVEIIRLGGEPSPNTGTFSLSVEADSDPGLSGFSATFKLRSQGTTVKLGG